MPSTNSVPPQGSGQTSPVPTTSPQKKYHAYDPRQWKQWVVNIIAKAKGDKTQFRGKDLLKKALEEKREGDTSLYKRSIKHITNPDAAKSMLKRQEKGDNSQKVSRKMSPLKTLGQGHLVKLKRYFLVGQARFL
ncbi:hypothetical protein M3P05_04285 [Sansalvadorimonas sp. 2012CJ34-2]|uniref:Uncharacterized protein n=1 Tax=Parendozoicomonas callyspongiae TaxID=2942213 RepID=A0ABT0PD60_9GAMM|nr:hypothetical protein [Sansalvadorimonas sp. 2012CJ34-2]MCL6269161.1 hypothetical protein [Sansalvadorimonas sp. 2012CJ34-2]